MLHRFLVRAETTKEATEAGRAATRGVGASHPASPASLQDPQKPDGPNPVVQGGEAADGLSRDKAAKSFTGVRQEAAHPSHGAFPRPKRSIGPFEPLSRAGKVGSPGRRSVPQRGMGLASPAQAFPPRTRSTRPSRRVTVNRRQAAVKHSSPVSPTSLTLYKTLFDNRKH